MIQFGSGHLLSPNLMPDPSQNLALVAPETREAHGGAEFPGFGLLLARDSECPLEILLRFRRIPLGRLNRDFTCDTIDLGLAPTFLGRVHHRHRIIFDVPSLIKLVEPFMGRLAKSEQSVKQGIDQASGCKFESCRGRQSAIFFFQINGWRNAGSEGWRIDRPVLFALHCAALPLLRLAIKSSASSS